MALLVRDPKDADSAASVTIAMTTPRSAAAAAAASAAVLAATGGSAAALTSPTASAGGALTVALATERTDRSGGSATEPRASVSALVSPVSGSTPYNANANANANANNANAGTPTFGGGGGGANPVVTTTDGGRSSTPKPAMALHRISAANRNTNGGGGGGGGAAASSGSMAAMASYAQHHQQQQQQQQRTPQSASLAVMAQLQLEGTADSGYYKPIASPTVTAAAAASNNVFTVGASPSGIRPTAPMVVLAVAGEGVSARERVGTFGGGGGAADLTPGSVPGGSFGSGGAGGGGGGGGGTGTPKKTGTPHFGPVGGYARERGQSGTNLGFGAAVGTTGGGSHLTASVGLTHGQALFDALLKVANSASEEEDEALIRGGGANNAVVSIHGTKGPAATAPHQRNGSRPASGIHTTAAAEAKEAATTTTGAAGTAYAVTTADEEQQRAAARAAAARKEAELKRKKNSPPITLVSFNEQLKAFKVLLVISGLHKDTSALYRWWLRVVIWSCTVLCTVNLFLQTRAYRSVLFDIALSLMHVWVSVAYEYWHKFLKRRHWQYLLCNQPSYEFFKVLRVLGVVGIVGIIGATGVITTGWIAPILRTWFDQVPSYGQMHGDHAALRDFWFLAIHGLWMTLIVTSWACVCITSMFLFFLTFQAHKSDIDQYARHVVAMFAENGAVRMSNQAAAAVIQLIVPVRRRLVITSRYFNHLSASFMLGFYLLLVGAVQNISDLLNHRQNFDAFKVFQVFAPLNLSLAAPVCVVPTPCCSACAMRRWVQDALFIGLGVAALFCGLWAASSLASYWHHTVAVLNAIPTLAQVLSSTAMVAINTGGTGGGGGTGAGGGGGEVKTYTYQPVGMTAGDLVVHNAVIQHLLVSPLCFQVYGVNLSKQTVLILCLLGVQVLAVQAFILNYPLH